MKVKTEDAINGTTTEDILNENAGLILPAGVLLSEALVRALLNQNIQYVHVEFETDDDAEKTATTASANKETSAFKEHVDHLFLRHRGQFMKEFQQCLLTKES